ncbi:Na+/H+ antiporter NhaC family protein [Limosilactobacillus gastricus]|uniref:Na+/H+ antiporter NhaC family protein n=1 Tax=Limosilactobacillus gastricus TaxID=227942 RepID=UPI0026EDE216|nr:Na+/H+ antiporter NhaC family protein [Limosilactobacillus gastricus]
MQDEPTLKFHGGMFMSLIPVVIYALVCATLFIYFKAFNMEALAAGGLVALLIGGLACTSYQKFWEAAINGISSIPSVSVIVILLMVGMFSALVKLCGLSNGFVWLANYTGIHGSLFVAFTFVATCIVSTATGSSLGTMFIAFPIFYSAGLALGGNPMMMAGSIVSGGIFGDNLAPISDTTIASSSTQQFNDGHPADVGGVVASRIKYSLVAGIITTIIFAVFGGVGQTYHGGALSGTASPITLIMLISVVIMLIVSHRTKNIYAGILTGLVLGTATGLLFHLFKFKNVFANHPSSNEVTGFLITGIDDMLPTVALVIAVFGMVGVLTQAGMLDYIADRILKSKLGRTVRGTEIISMIGISLITAIFGGVTSAAILTAGPIINKIGHARHIHPYRRANLLDGTANGIASIIPFMSVFVFIGAALTKLSPMVVAAGCIYPMVLFLTFLFAVITGWGRRIENDTKAK